jgi:hypothetical protein
MALGFTQPLAEMSTRKSFWAVKRGLRARPTTSSPSVSRLWEPRRFTTLWACTACYRDSFTFYVLMHTNLVYKTENTAVGIRLADHVAPAIRKSWH